MRVKIDEKMYKGCLC